MIAEVLVVKASDIAKLLSKPPEGDEVSVKFGRIFEEEYSLANHLYLSAWNTKKIPRLFARKVAARLKAEGIYRRELVLKAYRAYSALLNAGVVGEKPLTQFRELADSLFIAAQPDVYNKGSDTYYEFKLYPINDYARTQVKVFRVDPTATGSVSGAQGTARRILQSREGDCSAAKHPRRGPRGAEENRDPGGVLRRPRHPSAHVPATPAQILL